MAAVEFACADVAPSTLVGLDLGDDLDLEQHRQVACQVVAVLAEGAYAAAFDAEAVVAHVDGDRLAAYSSVAHEDVAAAVAIVDDDDQVAVDP